MNTVPVLETMRLDLRDAMRQLRRRPLVTAIAWVLLAVGIGASAAAFSVAYGVLVRPLPYPEADRIAVLWATANNQPTQISIPDFNDLRTSVPFESSAALASGRVTLTGGVEADRVTMVQSEHGLLPILGARPTLGRLTTGEDEGQSVAVISHRLWRTVFASDPNIVGRPIGISGSTYTVVGVVDPQLMFELPVPSGGTGAGFVVKDVDIWTPFNLVPGVTLSRAVSTCEAIVRLKAGQTLGTTQAAVDVVGANLATAYPDTNRDRRFLLTRLQDQVVETRSPAVLMGLAGGVLLLLIACANVASLFLGELPERRRDFALRAALGAGRGRLIRQLILEGFLLSIAGGAAGVVLARAVVEWLKRVADLPRIDAIQFDLPVTLWLVGAAVAAGVVARLTPLMRLSAARDSLRVQPPTYSASAPALRRTLVAVQLALAVVLSGTALLLAFSLRTIISVDPGFAPSRTLASRVSAYTARYPDKAAAARFVNELVRRISGLPGVDAAAAGQAVPLVGMAGTSVGVEGRAVPMSERPTASWFTVTPGYFRTLGITVVAGRDFTAGDLERPTHQTVINRVLARRLFGDENPIGRRVAFGPDDAPADWHEIVGVVGDVRQGSLLSTPDAAAYDLYGQHWGRSVYLVARGTTDPYLLAPGIRGVVRAVDPEAPVFEVQSLDDIVNGTIAPRRMATGFAVAVAAISLLLAAIGLYGLLASSVASRTREIGIRRALGSSTSGIVGLVFTEAALLAALGAVTGIAAALAVARVIQSQLFGIQATDGRVVALVAATLAVIASVAAYIPARRAAGVDPAIALRDE